jgi:cysteine synthase
MSGTIERPSATEVTGGPSVSWWSLPNRPSCRAARREPITSRAAASAAAGDYDEVVAIPEAEAFETARQAARTEGIFSGPSTGANIAAALAVARRLGPGHRVVTIQVDSGLKYLAGQLYA